MKKTLMIALAGMMLFAFTQCGNGNKDVKTDTPEVVNDAGNVQPSKQFIESTKYLEELTSIMENINTCEDLAAASSEIQRISNEMLEKLDGYAANEQMTAEEAIEYQKIAEKYTKLTEEKAKLCM